MSRQSSEYNDSISPLVKVIFFIIIAIFTVLFYWVIIPIILFILLMKFFIPKIKKIKSKSERFIRLAIFFILFFYGFILFFYYIGPKEIRMFIWISTYLLSVPVYYLPGVLPRKCQTCKKWFFNGISRCQICKKWFCKSCRELHTHVCSYCNREFSLKENFAICTICKRILCEDCNSMKFTGEMCPICGKMICCQDSDYHFHICTICGRKIAYPMNAKKCDICGKIICESCIDTYWAGNCNSCGRDICKNCSYTCIVCENIVCPDCWNGNEEFPKCKHCHSSGRCDICFIEKRTSWNTVDKNCPQCGLSVCSYHWNYRRNLCVNCAKKYPNLSFQRSYG